MKILLDTHILLWVLSNDERLPKKVKQLTEDGANQIYYSIISLWEVEIKHLAHPDAMPLSAEELLGYCEKVCLQRISISPNHIFAMQNLTRTKNAPPHKDPFDKMLICQASSENMIFITHDSLISYYTEPCILCV